MLPLLANFEERFSLPAVSTAEPKGGAGERGQEGRGSRAGGGGSRSAGGGGGGLVRCGAEGGAGKTLRELAQMSAVASGVDAQQVTHQGSIKAPLRAPLRLH